MKKFIISQELKEIIETVKILENNQKLKINSFAGTGKTTTLEFITKELKNATFLLLVFNNKNAKESKKRFGANTVVSTVNGLAYRKIVKDPDDVLDDGFNIEQIAQILNTDDNEIAFDVKKIINIYCNSDLENIKDVAEYYSARNIKSWDQAIIFYQLMRDYKIQMTHSFYLKEFSLTFNPNEYNYDFVLLDEAQDTNEVTLSFFNKFNSKQILVGDRHQAIYRFRGAVNAMEKVQCDYELFLSKTYRCSPNVVKYANVVLHNFKGEGRELESAKIDNSGDDNVAHITRNNSTAIFMISKFDEFHLFKSPDKLFKDAIQVHFFLTGQHEKLFRENQYFKKYKNKKELLDYAIEFDDVNLQSAIKVASIFKGYLFVLLNKAKLKNNPKSKIKILTAHTSKGLEFGNVVLASDFQILSEIEDPDDLAEEANLLYVAITRAKDKINFTKKEGFSHYLYKPIPKKDKDKYKDK